MASPAENFSVTVLKVPLSVYVVNAPLTSKAMSLVNVVVDAGCAVSVYKSVVV